eukprot:COSAG01_NODE_7048_length_3376_cov_40.918828_1_plen_30_part_10
MRDYFSLKQGQHLLQIDGVTIVFTTAYYYH